MKKIPVHHPVVKGLAFPIGYTVFMNIFQAAAILLIVAFCFARAIVSLIAVPDMGAEIFMDRLMLDYSTTTTDLALFLSALTIVAALLILWFVFNRKEKSFAEYFRFTPAPAKAIWAAVLLGLSVFFIFLVLQTLLQTAAIWLMETGLALLREMGVDVTAIENFYYALMEELASMENDFGMFVIAVVLGAPLAEELVFRAGPLKHLTKKMPAFYAILLTSALFALAHGSPFQMIYTFALGMISGYLFIKTDSIYPSLVCHLTLNGANLIVMALQSIFRTDLWSDTPYYEQISTKLDIALLIVTWAFLVLALIVSIPMLIVGIRLLVGLRRSTPVAGDGALHTSPAPTAQIDAAHVMPGDMLEDELDAPVTLDLPPEPAPVFVEQEAAIIRAEQDEEDEV